jgi:hypothetical protein
MSNEKNRKRCFSKNSSGKRDSKSSSTQKKRNKTLEKDEGRKLHKKNLSRGVKLNF